jgi:hypothetical protein
MAREPLVADEVAIGKERSGHEASGVHEASQSSLSKSRPTLMGIKRILRHTVDRTSLRVRMSESRIPR